MGFSRSEYTGYSGARVALTRRGYLIIFVMLVALLAAGAYGYLRYRTNKTLAECDTPAPPPKPAAPPPNLPGFTTEAGCAPGASGKK